MAVVLHFLEQNFNMNMNTNIIIYLISKDICAKTAEYNTAYNTATYKYISKIIQHLYVQVWKMSEKYEDYMYLLRVQGKIYEGERRTDIVIYKVALFL